MPHTRHKVESTSCSPRANCCGQSPSSVRAEHCQLLSAHECEHSIIEARRPESPSQTTKRRRVDRPRAACAQRRPSGGAATPRLSQMMLGARAPRRASQTTCARRRRFGARARRSDPTLLRLCEEVGELLAHHEEADDTASNGPPRQRRRHCAVVVPGQDGPHLVQQAEHLVARAPALYCSCPPPDRRGGKLPDPAVSGAAVSRHRGRLFCVRLSWRRPLGAGRHEHEGDALVERAPRQGEEDTPLVAGAGAGAPGAALAPLPVRIWAARSRGARAARTCALRIGEESTRRTARNRVSCRIYKSSSESLSIHPRSSGSSRCAAHGAHRALA